MQLLTITAIIAMLWMSTVSGVVIAGHLNSMAGWTVLAVVAVIPPLVMMWRWNEPRQTMSEAIQEARR